MNYHGEVVLSEMLGERTEQFIQELVAMLTLHLEEAEQDPAVAKATAESITDKICQTFGGSEIYIPQGRKTFAARRQKQIFEEFRGNNYQALAKKYGLTPKTVRKIVRDMSLELRKRSQSEMDLGGNGHGNS